MTRLLPILALALFAGCSSTPRSGGTGPDIDGEPTRVSFRDYRSSVRLTLINDAFLVNGGIEGETAQLRAAAFYSNRNQDLNVKVISNALMEGMLEYFDEKGFSSNAQDGKGPPSTMRGPNLSTSLEVGVSQRYRNWRFDPSWRTAPSKVAKNYVEAKDVFLNIHREIQAWQAAGAGDWNFDGVKVKQGEWR
jgi:hypothetical protein